MTNESERYPISKIAGPSPPHPTEFGQGNVAARIVQHLENDGYAKIALEGPYGSGKTTVLNAVETRLVGAATPEKPILVVRYEPWKYSPDATTLRRTFLTTMEDALVKEKLLAGPMLDRVRFHETTKKEENLSPGEKMDQVRLLLQEFRESFTLHAQILFGIALVSLLVALGALFLDPLVEVDLAQVNYVVLPLAALAVSVFIAEAARGVMRLRVPQTKDIVEPRIYAIDQFEEFYKNFLEILASRHSTRRTGPAYRVVVLIDDLDRCQDDEIRTVLSGLSTYMSSPPGENFAPVSFVVALDTERAEAILTGQKPKSSLALQRHNELGKHFNRFVPVPQPTLQQLREIISRTAKRDGWNFNERYVHEMGRLAAVSLRFNLRSTIFMVLESNQIREYGIQLLAATQDPNLKKFVSSPSLLFRVALMRNLSTESALRNLVSNPAHWGRRTYPGGLAVDIVKMDPPFAIGGLDPTPLLQLSVGREVAYDPGELPGLVAKLHAPQADQMRTELEQIVDPAACLHVAYYALSSLRPGSGNLSDDQKARLANAAVHFMVRGKDAFTEDHVDLFRELVKLIEHDPIRNQLPTDIDNWVEAAFALGKDGAEILLREGNAFHKDNGRRSQLYSAVSKTVHAATNDIASVFVQSLLQRANSGEHQNALTWLGHLMRHPKADEILGLGKLIVALMTRIDLRQKQPEFMFAGVAVGAVRRDVSPDEIAKLQGHIYSVELPTSTKDHLGQFGWATLFDEAKRAKAAPKIA